MRQPAYDGGDDTFTVTGIRQVSAGARTTTLRVGKWGGSGPGTVTLNDPNVMAFFFSPGEANAQVCEDQVSESWFTWRQDFNCAALAARLNLRRKARCSCRRMATPVNMYRRRPIRTP